ncbi:MAG: hypothetical protein ACRDY6_04330 [Acidimicrobiia bacterium]
MTMHPRTRRPRLLTASAAAPILAAVTLLGAACASSPSNEAASSGDRDQAIAYAQCMRENGVADFPDPDANGRFTGIGHEQRDDPKFRAAQEACRDLAPGGEHENLGDPAFVEQMREFSQCMRENGLPDFPDPDPDGRLRGAGHEERNDPQYQAALETCRTKLPGGGEHGG